MQIVDEWDQPHCISMSPSPWQLLSTQSTAGSNPGWNFDQAQLGESSFHLHALEGLRYLIQDSLQAMVTQTFSQPTTMGFQGLSSGP